MRDRGWCVSRLEHVKVEKCLECDLFFFWTNFFWIIFYALKLNVVFVGNFIYVFS